MSWWTGRRCGFTGYLRATEDVDLLIKASRINGEKLA
jgi:hypothetical protein